jgi:hypothetical protein
MSWQKFKEDLFENMATGFEEGIEMRRDHPLFKPAVTLAFLVWGFIVCCFCVVLFRILRGL